MSKGLSNISSKGLSNISSKIVSDITIRAVKILSELSSRFGRRDGSENMGSLIMTFIGGLVLYIGTSVYVFIETGELHEEV